MERYEIPERAAQWQGDRILFGCDYNPEQWPREVWADDVRLMQEAGIDIVAINIFGWARINTGPGQFAFEELDEIIELLHHGGIQINLGTGTSSPPPWLTALHPEILPVMADGSTRWPGGRQAWCPSSPVFRRYAIELVDRVAQRYGNHPGVVLWHVSNEIGCHNAHCYCDVSAAAFRAWLHNRYGSIEKLNEAWGTTFWSQRYTALEEILPPRDRMAAANPAHVLDFERFSSDELLSYYRAEAATIRAVSAKPVTTNFMITAHISTMDYWSWAPEMDIIANDHYLDNRLADPISELAFSADLTRGLANGNPWMLMETATSAVSWQPQNLAILPGDLALNIGSHIARGADGICFFQWRSSRQGAEKFHSALLPHAGEDSKIWRESLELGRLLKALAPVSGSRVRAQAAIVFSWESWWATRSESHPSNLINYLDELHRAYRSFTAAGVTVDFVSPDADLSGYEVVAVPCLYLVRDSEARAMAEWVDAGGTLIVSYFSGLVDEDLRLRTDVTGHRNPGAFSELLGAWTEEYFPLKADDVVTLDDGSSATLWTEKVRTTTASVVRTFSDGPVAGHPAVTSRVVGSGRAIYVATSLDDDGYARLVGRAVADAGVVAQPAAAGVESVVRTSPGNRFTFVVNRSEGDVEVAGTGTELVTGSVVAAGLVVPPRALRVLHEVIPG